MAVAPASAAAGPAAYGRHQRPMHPDQLAHHRVVLAAAPGEKQRQPGAGAAERPGHGHDVPDAGPRTPYRTPALQVPERRHRNHDHPRGRPTEIPAEDGAIGRPGRRRDPPRQLHDPLHERVRIGEQRHQQPGRDRTHGGDIAEILRHRLAADVLAARPVVAPVVPAHHGVGRGHERAARNRHHRGVVARAEQDPAARALPRPHDRHDDVEQLFLRQRAQPRGFTTPLGRFRVRRADRGIHL
jgi:hypothetical protein